MFTGHVQEVGSVCELADGTLSVAAPRVAADLVAGQTVSVAGVQLTASAVSAAGFVVSVSEETRRRSTLGAGDGPVNVELPVRAGDRLGGSLLQGCVDAVGKVVGIEPQDTAVRVWIRPPKRFLDALAAKTRVAVDGVSLTVAEVVRDRFSVVIVPATLNATTLVRLDVGARVNLERDLAERLAGGDGVRAALRDAVAALPWAGWLAGESAADQAAAQLAAGGGVLIWDPVLEGEADLVIAGAQLDARAVGFVLTEVCGYPTVPCTPEILDRLEIPQAAGSGDKFGTAFCNPVDLRSNPSTGVSAFERAATIRALADPATGPSDFLAPGHVTPLRAAAGGLAARQGHTEASLALCELAGVAPVALICELMEPDGTMARADGTERFALRHGLPIISIAQLM